MCAPATPWGVAPDPTLALRQLMGMEELSPPTARSVVRLTRGQANTESARQKLSPTFLKASTLR